MSLLELQLAYPPTVNTYWRHVGPKVLISAKGRRYHSAVARELMLRRVRPLEGPLAIDIGFHPPDRRRRDIDNLLKSLLDALQRGGAYADDNQLADIRLRRLSIKPPLGLTIVRLQPLTEEGEL